MSRKDWTAPAPLEIERPRLPWWAMIPAKGLFIRAPLILAWALVRLLDFTARRVYRYPLALLGTTGLVVLGVRVGWWWALGTLLAVAVVMLL